MEFSRKQWRVHIPGIARAVVSRGERHRSKQVGPFLRIENNRMVSLLENYEEYTLYCHVWCLWISKRLLLCVLVYLQIVTNLPNDSENPFHSRLRGWGWPEVSWSVYEVTAGSCSFNSTRWPRIRVRVRGKMNYNVQYAKLCGWQQTCNALHFGNNSQNASNSMFMWMRSCTNENYNLQNALGLCP